MDTTAKISAVINTLNEERNIRRCLESVKWCDEIVIVDMFSDDRTVEITREFTDKIFTHERMGYVEPARNYALSQASNEWILLMDADEVVPETLAMELRRLASVNDNEVSVYQIPEKNVIFGQWIKHTGWWPDFHPRLFRNGVLTWDTMIHSEPHLSRGTVRRLAPLEELAIVHYPYRTRREFIGKMNNYTDKEALFLRERKGRRFTERRALARAIKEFYLRYIKYQGFKDGKNGLILSVYMAFYYFLSYSKILDLEENPGEVYENGTRKG